MTPRVLPFALAWLVFTSGTDTVANLYIPNGTGTTLAPLKSEDISMDDERVLVVQEPVDESARVTAVYTMRNHSDRTIETHVAFPFREKSHYAMWEKDNFRVTMSSVEGESIEPACEVIRPLELPQTPYDFGVAFVWPATWAAGETKEIKVEYTVGSMDLRTVFLEGWRLSYVVNTGAFWKGPIGSAEFTFRFTDPYWPNSAFEAARHPDVAYPRFSYADYVERISPTEVRWRFENWVPSEDVWIGYIRFVGMEGPFDLLDVRHDYQARYEGAKKVYDDAMLERYSSGWLDLHRRLFPEQTRRLAMDLKAYHAKRFYYEILAQNGDPLLVRKERRGDPRPAEAIGESKWGYYHSVWREHFEECSAYYEGRFDPSAPTGVRSEWYRPGTGKGRRGSVRLEDLTPLERQNLAFLRSHFENDPVASFGSR